MKKEKEKKSVVSLLLGFMDRVSGDHVGAYATQAAYFLILSFIPCILFPDNTGQIYTDYL